MSLHSKVVWSQGMFLLPHHFQQEARHVEYEIDMRVRATGPHAWGFFELALDEGLLAVGRLGLTRAAGVLPDGTPFSIPQHDAQPVPLDVPADLKGEIVYLAVPLAREGVTQVGFDGLAVNAHMPAEQLRTRFPAQSKLGPPERLRDLVNLQLPGIVLRSLPTAPRQLPFHAGFHYFELDRGGELWKQLERSGSLALHVAGEFPALELELWAIRQ